MLKVRIIPVLLARGRELVKGERFQSWRRVGTVMQAARVHQMRGVDELILLDIEATREGRGPDLDLVRDLTGECFMPITVGGGVSSVDHVRSLLRAGADKVSIGTAAAEGLSRPRPALIADSSLAVGAQAVVVSMDVRDGEVVTRNGDHRTGLDPVAWAQTVAEAGTGEILLCSVDRDGTMQGYDLELIRAVAGAVSIPVIASGGCRDYADMADALRAGAHAVGVGALFTFTDATPRGAAVYLSQHGFPARLAA